MSWSLTRRRHATRLIDSLLASVGWDVAAGLNSTAEVGKEIEVTNQPTESGVGYADYVLWDDNGKPLAVIEAKKTSSTRSGRHQAKLYADGLEKMHGQRPVIFYTNGYDIWIWDDAQGYPPRKLSASTRRTACSISSISSGHERKPLDTHRNQRADRQPALPDRSDQAGRRALHR